MEFFAAATDLDRSQGVWVLEGSYEDLLSINEVEKAAYKEMIDDMEEKVKHANICQFRPAALWQLVNDPFILSDEIDLSVVWVEGQPYRLHLTIPAEIHPPGDDSVCEPWSLSLAKKIWREHQETGGCDAPAALIGFRSNFIRFEVRNIHWLNNDDFREHLFEIAGLENAPGAILRTSDSAGIGWIQAPNNNWVGFDFRARLGIEAVSLTPQKATLDSNCLGFSTWEGGEFRILRVGEIGCGILDYVHHGCPWWSGDWEDDE